jgi:DNA-binding Lrp family transcriptional regulator
LKSLGYAQDKKLDSPVKAFVQVRLSSKNIDRGKIHDFVTDIPNVSQADVVLGPYDLCLTINARDIESLQDTVSKIQTLSFVSRTATSISTGTIQGINVKHISEPDRVENSASG